MFDAARTALGVARSLHMYYGGRHRTQAMTSLYRPLVPAGSLAFDIGSHVGDRVLCFRRLGARVVAVEPQAALARTLRVLFKRDAAVTIHEAAVGAEDGEVQMHLNLANPTVSTASTDFIAAANGAAGWVGQRWTHTQWVAMLTLDGLISRHGLPEFVKIDVEGMESQVLAGLSQPVAALSFEFTTIQRSIALQCVRRCSALGDYTFNAALGESQRLLHPQWLHANAISAWLTQLGHEANSGDVYARLTPASASQR